MTYLLNKIAEYDIHVARYYMKRKAYIAAVNRAKNIYLEYPDSIHVQESLVIQYIAYRELGLKDLEKNTMKIIDNKILVFITYLIILIFRHLRR